MTSKSLSDLKQYVDDIPKFHQSTDIFKDNSKSAITKQPSVSKEQKDSDSLQELTDHFEYLNDILSLNSNKYLACRWNSFLDNVPENYIKIHLYLDKKSFLKNRVVRRKLLNGSFYGFDNKLAPTPK